MGPQNTEYGPYQIYKYFSNRWALELLLITRLAIKDPKYLGDP